jgi:hypothetical protein
VGWAILIGLLLLGGGGGLRLGASGAAPPPPPPPPPRQPTDRTAEDWKTAIGVGGTVLQGVIGLFGDAGSGGKVTTDGGGDTTTEKADAHYLDDPKSTGSTGLWGDLGSGLDTVGGGLK